MNNKYISIFGASGGTGRVLVRRALERGFYVTALVRSEAAREKLSQTIPCSLGSLFDLGTVEHAVFGMDAVVSVIGQRAADRQPFCAEATRNIIAAMKSQGVKRLVCVTGAMIGDYAHLTPFMRFQRALYRIQRPAVARDRAEQERLVQESGLDWTLIKPPLLTDDRPRVTLYSGPALIVGGIANLTRGNLARFILDEIENPRYISQRIVVQN